MAHLLSLNKFIHLFYCNYDCIVFINSFIYFYPSLFEGLLLIFTNFHIHKFISFYTRKIGEMPSMSSFSQLSFPGWRTTIATVL